MLSMRQFNALPNVAQSNYLLENFPANSLSLNRRKTVCGVGVNDAKYMIAKKLSGKQVMCPAYRAWKDMLVRAYSTKHKAKRPTYIGVTVCEKWLSFSSFRSWWLDNQVDGWELDKDLLTYSREYGPKSCIYVPTWLNSFTIDCGGSRGDFPVGVSWRKASVKYEANCGHPFGKPVYLGLFSSATVAHDAWLSCKLEIAAELKQKMDEIDRRIYPRVVDIIIHAI